VPSGFVTGIAFDGRRRVYAEELSQALDRRDAGCLDLLRRGQRVGEGRRTRDRLRDVAVGRIVAVLARDEQVSPELDGARKSTLNLPPMIPLSAWTSYASSSQRAKIFLYAPRDSPRSCA
jgi:hypothetical protein